MCTKFEMVKAIVNSNMVEEVKESIINSLFSVQPVCTTGIYYPRSNPGYVPPTTTVAPNVLYSGDKK